MSFFDLSGVDEQSADVPPQKVQMLLQRISDELIECGNTTHAIAHLVSDILHGEHEAIGSELYDLQALDLLSQTLIDLAGLLERCSKLQELSGATAGEREFSVLRLGQLKKRLSAN